MPKSIVTVGFDVAADATSFESIESKASLLDYDIVLISPIIDQYISVYEDSYLGKPCLTDDKSFAVKEACEHWRREIFQAVEVGKSVVVFLPEKREIYIATGGNTTSGTGRSQKVTRHVDIYSNYKTIPMDLNPINASGSSMKLNPRFETMLKPYWTEFETESKYKVVIDDKIVSKTIYTKVGDKAVGAISLHAKSGGYLLLLPAVDFEQQGFLSADKATYTPKAQRFATRFLSRIVELDRAIRSSGERSIEPVWAKHIRFSSRVEVDLRAKLIEAETKLASAQKQKESVVDALNNAGRLRALLFENGASLEQAIIDALKMLGFQAEHYKEGHSEFDVVFTCAEGRLLGEAEGKDSKAINVDKLRQLAMNIHEDLLRPEVANPAKGVLFGNGFRFVDPAARDQQFTQKCMLAAQSSSVALVSTADLFAAVNCLFDQQDEDFTRECRKAILDGVGPVVFPPSPAFSLLASAFVENGPGSSQT